MSTPEMPQSTSRLICLDELTDYELAPGGEDPTRFTVIGQGDFVLGTVARLIVDPVREEVVYLVVNTRISNFRESRGEERLVPLAWCELMPVRRQARLPQLPWYAFRLLPLFRAEGPLPESIEFPRPFSDDLDLPEIA